MNTTPKKTNQEFAHTPIFDPFPKPQTMPSGWDLSEIFPPQNLSAIGDADTSAEN